MATIKKNTEAPSDKSWYDILKTKSDNSIFSTINQLPSVISSEPLTANLLTGPLNKLQRARILTSRASEEFEKVSDNGPLPNGKTTINRNKTSPVQVSREASSMKQVDPNSNEQQAIPIRFKRTEELPPLPIPEVGSRLFNNKVYIINRSISPYIKLEIQGMPSEVEVNPETSWAVIKSPGKNGAYYNYNGSEDTITMEISWYSVHPEREDVLTKCRLLESWSKADGPYSSPPTLDILWGNSNQFSSEGQAYILYSAKYKLANFQNSAKVPTVGVVDLKLLPNSATQTLVFKKVTEFNQSHEDILNRVDLSKFGQYGITTGQ
jgi:hypothetical protein